MTGLAVAVRQTLASAREMNPWNDWVLAQLVALMFNWTCFMIIVLKS